MILTSFIFLAWGISFWYLMLPRTLSFIDILIFWFVNSIVMVCTLTILMLNLGWITYSEKTEMFLTFLLTRSFIDPMLLLIYASIVSHTKNLVKKFGTSIGIFLTFIVMEYFLVKLDVITFVKFNYLYVSLMFAFFLLVAYILVRILRKGEHYEDYSI